MLFRIIVSLIAVLAWSFLIGVSGLPDWACLLLGMPAGAIAMCWVMFGGGETR